MLENNFEKIVIRWVFNNLFRDNNEQIKNVVYKETVNQ